LFDMLYGGVLLDAMAEIEDVRAIAEGGQDTVNRPIERLAPRDER
jgi:hypothetical protein